VGPHEIDEAARRGGVTDAGRDPGGVDNDILQFVRQRTDQFDAFDGQYGDDLLHADLRLAFRDKLGDGAARQLRIRLRLFRDAEPLQQRRYIGAARTVAVGD